MGFLILIGRNSTKIRLQADTEEAWAGSGPINHRTLFTVGRGLRVLVCAPAALCRHISRALIIELALEVGELWKGKGPEHRACSPF